MTNQEKFEKLKVWLTENGYKYKENFTNKACKTVIPLSVKDWYIVFHIGDSQEFFLAVRHFYHPIFIREEESFEFLIEKFENTRKVVLAKMKEYEDKKRRGIEEHERCQARHKEKMAEKMRAIPKRKRQRIQHYEKVEPTRE